MLVNYHKDCRICGKELVSIYNFGEQNLDGLFILPNFSPPKRKLPLELCFCTSCNLTQQRYSVDPDILYASYGYLSSCNSQMTNHLDKIVKDIVDMKVDCPNPKCLDVGSNDGYLLKQYPDNYVKVGIDPGYFTLPDNIQFINELYPSRKLIGKRFNFLTYIACLYDNNDPVSTVKAIKDNLLADGVAVVEVSYWPEKMRKTAFEEACREHVCFYSYENLESIFNTVGLKIFRAELNEINGGSIQIWLCYPEYYAKYSNFEYKREIARIKIEEFDMALNEGKTYQAFIRRCEKLREDSLRVIREIKEWGKTIHLLGASTKISVWLSYLGLTERDIPYAAERNPTKWNGRMLGSNIKMISEEKSRAMNPDFYLVSIWGFRQSVIEREREFIERGGKLIFPIGKEIMEIYPNE